MTISKHSMQSRLLFIVIGGLLLLLAVSLGSLIALNNSLNDYRTLMSQHVSFENQINDMNFNFKVQVQEWKNVLIRGHDPSQLNKYWGKFQKQQDNVQNSGKSLLPKLPAGEKQSLISSFIDSHRTMGLAYKRGYDDFIAAGFDHKAGDKAVKGIDRAPSKQLKEAAALLNKNARVLPRKLMPAAKTLASGHRSPLLPLPYL